MKNTSILFVPEKRYRKKLLGDSPGGGRPPIAYQHDPFEWKKGVCEDLRPLDWKMNGYAEALILVWEGEVDVMGCEQLARVSGMKSKEDWTRASASILAGMAEHCDIGQRIDLPTR